MVSGDTFTLDTQKPRFLTTTSHTSFTKAPSSSDSMTQTPQKRSKSTKMQLSRILRSWESSQTRPAIPVTTFKLCTSMAFG